MDTIADPHAATVTAFRGWARAFGRYDDDRTVQALIDSATNIAETLNDASVATTIFEPGNATRYVVTVSALHKYDAVTLGGRHLISLPLQHRCAVFTLIGLQTPEWVKDEFRLTRDDDALLYAGVLSLIGDLAV